MKILSILDRYIIRKFLGTYIFSIILIISISVVFDINEKLDKFLNNNAPLKAIVFDYYMNFIPYYTNLFSALFVFIAVIFFTSKLADNSEIIAMLSNGMSFKRLMKPYMISAGVIAIFSFLLSSFIIPPANKDRIAFQNKYIKDRSVDYATSVQLQVDKGVILYLERFDNKTREGYNLTLDKLGEKGLESRLIATRIQYDTANHWVLNNYSIREFQGMKEVITSGSKLDTTINVVPSDFLVSVNDFEQMTTPALYKYIQRQKERGLASVGDVSITQFEIEFHKRFSSVFSAFILTLIGAALSARKVKGGMGLNIGIGLGLSVSYIMFQTVSSSFAVSGTMPPMLAVWIPNILFMFIAAYLYSKAPN
ncbi:lipopolysaccharide export system permease protein [Dysgonomonas sp. PFB1-18]|uniref:LptF/LptG family permease n=1 Tax=unclassified Dysgonomonas TaxID=2630389 RepID=UPI00247479ED|nr:MULTISPECIES: LptF/LptG family permease [unclassified Dysgonomonas]MDH6309661.1 lipopolysaccharide export system permease protein [Dysgonomonas sp. PF1-14]MDH6339331.1 lipopolysaccharide export system permease protein [Dysgonomonas sp. PF1-16]MDH6380830.1 lipopolysaccharide export system permease protein [Dysgonomonas sp. PFB1-18]MDH6398326.1 lipopolysaccharide export system permease protein [Dysgonomonas sp. PF1-23]